MKFNLLFLLTIGIFHLNLWASSVQESMLEKLKLGDFRNYEVSSKFLQEDGFWVELFDKAISDGLIEKLNLDFFTTKCTPSCWEQFKNATGVTEEILEKDHIFVEKIYSDPKLENFLVMVVCNFTHKHALGTLYQSSV